jgi:hypothetical protein
MALNSSRRRLHGNQKKGQMITTLMISLLAVLCVGLIAAPGLGAFGLVVVPLVGVAVVWWIAAAAVTKGRPSDLVVRTKHGQLLGPGGPDDPFVNEHRDEG